MLTNNPFYRSDLDWIQRNAAPLEQRLGDAGGQKLTPEELAWTEVFPGRSADDAVAMGERLAAVGIDRAKAGRLLVRLFQLWENNPAHQPDPDEYGGPMALMLLSHELLRQAERTAFAARRQRQDMLSSLRRDHTIADLGAQIGVSHQAVSKIIKGKPVTAYPGPLP